MGVPMVRRRLLALALALTLTAAPGPVSGCSAGQERPQFSAGTASAVGATRVASLEPASQGAQEATITADRGAEFYQETPSGNVAVLVTKGTFAPGTVLTFTPLASAEPLVVQPGFQLSADGGAQPRLPVAVAFELPGALPEGAALVAYDSESSPGRLVRSQEARADGRTTVFALVNHFTYFRIDHPGDAVQDYVEEGDESGFKAWRVKANDQQLVPDTAPWVVHSILTMNVLSESSSIGGPYRGSGTLTWKGRWKPPPIKGTADGSWGGSVEFNAMQVTLRRDRPKPRPGQPDPAQHLNLVAHGTFTLKTRKPWTVRLSGRNWGGGLTAPMRDGEVDISLEIAPSGAYIILGDLVFDGVPVGVLS
ncbi:MAG: hypothetical protein WAL91_03535 [Propionicimonas sp.]